MLLPFARTFAYCQADLEDTLRHNLKKACSDPSFGMLFLGFSVAVISGFHDQPFSSICRGILRAIAVGGLLEDQGIASTSALGAAIAVVGRFLTSSVRLQQVILGPLSKKISLSAIYLARTIMATAFILCQ